MRIRDERVVIDGRSTRYLERGSGRPVVLVHGLGLAADCWKPHLDLIARDGYRPIAPDLPGFGRSRGGGLGMHVPETAEWLNRFADTLQLPPAAWVGHSVSAQVLLRLAAAHPRRVAVLVLAAPTGAGAGAARAVRQITRLALDAFRERPRLVVGVLSRYLRNPVATAGTWVRAVSHRPELDAPAVRAPVLLVIGEDDPVVRYRFALLLRDRLSDAQLERLPEAGHAVALDPYVPFCERTLAFLRHRYPPDPAAAAGPLGP